MKTSCKALTTNVTFEYSSLMDVIFSFFVQVQSMFFGWMVNAQAIFSFIIVHFRFADFMLLSDLFYGLVYHI